MVYVRFEWGQQDKVSKEYGPFSYAQITFNDMLRVEQKEESLAIYDHSLDLWVVQEDHEWYTDIIIYSKGEPDEQTV